MRLNAYRGLTKTMQSGIPGPEGSLGKWQWADINQGLTELALEIEGAYAPLARGSEQRDRQRRLAVRLPALARQLDRGRHHRHPQEHHRRAGARPAEAALRLDLAMYFDLTDEQQAIKSTAHDFLASRFKSERMRELAASDDGFDAAGWDEMAELGWTGLALPEEWGGQGLGIVELAVLFEEMGYALAPSPLFSNTIAGLALDACAAPMSCASAFCDRSPPGRSAARRRSGTPAPRRRPAASRWRRRPTATAIVLDGEKVLVPDAAGADFFLVATADGRRHLVERDADGRHGQRRNPRSIRPAASTRCTSTASASPPPTPAGRRGRLLPRLLSPLRRARRGVDRDRPADDGDGRRVRQRPRAVRPPDRRLPGGLAPLRADAAGDRELPLRRLRRRLGRRRRARVAAAGGLDGEGLRLRRRLARPRRLDPGSRRHRLHLGARPPLLPQARPLQRRDLRRREVAPRDGSPSWCSLAPPCRAAL